MGSQEEEFLYKYVYCVSECYDKYRVVVCSFILISINVSV